MRSIQIERYDALVNAHTLKLLESLTLKTGDEDIALHATVLSFEKLWHHMEKYGEPQNTFEWLQIEAERTML
ncbi:hypothetical protein [Vibrio atypicus]|uniref:hypothetical protein n=1 Tax=Vibrio atypicus TaxID=558271 RepID=UPI00135B41D3|nr:hypothetical protein [Vibrio atypicus]